jgi:phage gp29-like protein
MTDAPAIRPEVNTGASAISTERIERAIQLRYSPFPELTMELLTRQLNGFRIGHLAPMARTWEIMFERDGELASPALKRFADAARLPWDIEKSEDSAEADAHAEALRYFYTHLTATSVLDQDETGGLNLLLRQVMTAHAHRYSVHEILFRVDNAARREVTAEFRHCPVWFFESRRGRLGFLRREGDWQGELLAPGRWLRAVGAGHMRPCSIAYAVKHFPLRDWLLFSSRFGLPGVHGKTDAAKGSQEWEDFAAALTAFANDWVTLTNRGAEITLVDAAKSSAALPFKDLVERSDRLYARLFRGGDLSTQSREGDARGASLQDEEKDAMAEDDTIWLTETCNAGVDEPLIAYLFNTPPKAWFKLMVRKKPETDREVKGMEFLARHGGRVALRTAHERLQIPEADEGEETLSAPVATPVQAPGGEPAPDAVENTGNAGPDVVAYARSVADEVAPVIERLQRILAIQDDALMERKLREFYADFPQLEKDLLADPRPARVLEELTARALVKGFTRRRS